MNSIEEQLLVAGRRQTENFPKSVPTDVLIVAELGLDSIELMQFLLEVEQRFPKFRRPIPRPLT